MQSELNNKALLKENLILKKRLIDAQMQILEYQYQDVNAQLANLVKEEQEQKENEKTEETVDK